MHSWAYEFTSAISLTELERSFNEAGPWRWEMRDSSWYGDYLVAKPASGVRIRIQDPKQSGAVGIRPAPAGEHRYWAQLDVESKRESVRQSTDAAFRQLLAPFARTGPDDMETWV